MPKLIICLSFLIINVGFSSCRPGGPPEVDSVCTNVVPSINSPHSQQTGNGNYFISTDIPINMTAGFYDYTAGQSYTVQVLGIAGATFSGFLVQAWAPDHSRIGTFVTQNPQQQLLNCAAFGIPMATTIAHYNPSVNIFTSQSFKWMAPSSNGLVNFMYTVLQSRSQYYGALSAADQTQQPQVTEVIITDASTVGIPASVTNPDQTQQPQVSEVIITDAPTVGIPASVTNPTRSPEEYRITARIPTDCVVSECTVFVGIDTNDGESTYLDIYMEGTAQAWVAVGFSESQNMFSADVLACNVNPNTNVVEALDTWNIPNVRSNVLDSIQNVDLRSGRFTNGRIQCTMVREIAGSEVSTRDLNLDGSYYLLFGRGMTQTSGFLSSHELGYLGNPQISTSQINPTSGQLGLNDTSDDGNPQLSASTMKSDVYTIQPNSTVFGRAGERRMTSASWLIVSVLLLYSLALGA